jgi:DNA polymerase III subunit epsilon
MGRINQDIFVCLDCESTGLDPKNDKIIEIAAVKFTFDSIIDSFETLINPKVSIPKESQLIHNISDEMVKDMPIIRNVLEQFLDFISDHIIVGHGISFDISLLAHAAKNNDITTSIEKNKFIDTLRLARLYGGSPVNSLERLREHFNISPEGAHRAMNDVVVNIEVFKYLSKGFKTTEDLFLRLRKPILLKNIPLGKYKGREFNEIPLDYLIRLAKRNFDLDLTYSIRSEIKNRKKKQNFENSSNPFEVL